jgi:hypothetical protein
LINTSTGTPTTTTISFPSAINAFATDQNDQLIFYVTTASPLVLSVYDYITGTTFQLVNFATTFGTNSGYQITSLQYSNRNNLLYVGYNEGSFLSILHMQAYTRYPASVTPIYTFSTLNLGQSVSQLFSPNSFTIASIAIDDSVGNLLLACNKGTAASSQILLIDPVGNLLAYSPIGYQYQRCCRDNNQTFFAIGQTSGGTGIVNQFYPISFTINSSNQMTLTVATTASITPTLANNGVTGNAVPFYGM